MANDTLYSAPLWTTEEITNDGVAGLASAAVANSAALTFAAGAIDTGTDMTAAEAAQLVADILEIHTQLTALQAAMRTAGTLTT